MKIEKYLANLEDMTETYPDVVEYWNNFIKDNSVNKK